MHPRYSEEFKEQALIKVLQREAPIQQRFCHSASLVSVAAFMTYSLPC
jgi:transposase-like protein